MAILMGAAESKLAGDTSARLIGEQDVNRRVQRPRFRGRTAPRTRLARLDHFAGGNNAGGDNAGEAVPQWYLAMHPRCARTAKREEVPPSSIRRAEPDRRSSNRSIEVMECESPGQPIAGPEWEVLGMRRGP